MSRFTLRVSLLDTSCPIVIHKGAWKEQRGFCLSVGRATKLGRKTKINRKPLQQIVQSAYFYCLAKITNIFTYLLFVSLCIFSSKRGAERKTRVFREGMKIENARESLEICFLLSAVSLVWKCSPFQRDTRKHRKFGYVTRSASNGESLERGGTWCCQVFECFNFINNCARFPFGIFPH